ncbi:MAG: hypothetical protein JJV90_00015 [Spiroplasma sp.]|nr:hypothetical protein [Mycoplasmatales bacterium]
MTNYINKGKPIRVVVMYYALFIIGSMFVLKLPFLFQDGMSITWLEAFFTSNSSIATTGLTVFDFQETYNYLGWLALIVLFNIGGMGIIVLNILIMFILGKKLGLRYRNLAKMDINQNGVPNILTIVKGVVIFFLVFEVIGAFLIFIFSFGMYDSFSEHFMNSIFLSASATSGSGFFNFLPYANNYPIRYITMILMTFSYIGFPVILESYQFVKFHKNKTKGRFRFSRFTKIVVWVNAITIFIFTIIFFMLERNNTMVEMGLYEQVNTSLFMAMSTKSVGLNLFEDISLWNPLTLLLSAIFMVIGGSPSSACGGIKVVSVYIIFKYVIATMKGKKRVVSYQTLIPEDTVVKSFLLVFVFITISFIAAILISAMHSSLSLTIIWYDVISGFTTTGFSVGGLEHFNNLSIFLMSILMGVGRIGIMNILNLAGGVNSELENVSYVEADISV